MVDKDIPIGTKVKIDPSSQYYTRNSINNPKKTVGTIINNNESATHTIRVRWPEATNCYRDIDLVLVEQINMESQIFN